MKIEIPKENYLNAAIAENKQVELARILREIAEKIENGWHDGICRDLNGNTVGKWQI